MYNTKNISETKFSFPWLGDFCEIILSILEKNIKIKSSAIPVLKLDILSLFKSTVCPNQNYY